MDDGGISSSYETILHTRAFKLEEVDLLRKALEINFSLRTRVTEKVPNQWVIYIPVKQKMRLIDIVKPFMHESMLYKVKD
jgi:hypothetical protein